MVSRSMASPSNSTDYNWMRGISAVEESLGYRFRDKHLLLAALTHRSFCNENNTGTGDFDELEWLGDSVLQLAVSSWLFRTARGSRRTSGSLSLTRVRFVDAGACESFAQKLKLLPFLRIGHAQPVVGTKILADCFEAVLGAVYVDAGSCSDLNPVHEILARVIPSYEFARRSHSLHPRNSHGPPPPPPPPPAQHASLQRQMSSLHFPRTPFPPRAASAPEQRKGKVEEPRKILNLAHRIVQIAKKRFNAESAGGHGTEHLDPSAPSPPDGLQPDQLEVLVELDRRLRDFQQNTLRNGALSYSTATFTEEFGEEVARFYATAAANPGHGALLDRVLAGESNLRKDFAETPRGADLVVMGVVVVPSELRRQCFTVVDFLQLNILHQNVPPHQRAVRILESAPNGAETLSLLNKIVSESATSLLFTAHQRSVLSALTGKSPQAAPSHANGHFPHANSTTSPSVSSAFLQCSEPRFDGGGGSGRKRSPPPPPRDMVHMGRPGGGRGRGRGRGGRHRR